MRSMGEIPQIRWPIGQAELPAKVPHREQAEKIAKFCVAGRNIFCYWEAPIWNVSQGETKEAV